MNLILLVLLILLLFGGGGGYYYGGPAMGGGIGGVVLLILVLLAAAGQSANRVIDHRPRWSRGTLEVAGLAGSGCLPAKGIVRACPIEERPNG